MKGLLLKDWMMLKKYCRIYFFMLVIFAAASVGTGDNSFFVMYPMLLSGVLVVTLISYDERTRWNVYCNTLPCPKSMQVNEKYMITLLLVGVTFICLAVLQFVRQLLSGGINWNEYLVLLVILLTVGILPTTILLPIVFRWGVERGRIAYYVVIAGGVAGGMVFSNLIPIGNRNDIPVLSGRFLPLLVLLILAFLLAVSWMLSLRFYQKREL
ncbi:MAG: ABC-2 transporter permease [Lachnospiraceae bacterium]|nr:ABC-2 transporter permease [Lachnospiraceae bacterium]